LFFAAQFQARGQKPDYLLSVEGIGPVKLGMSLDDLQKLVQTPITLKVIGIDSVVLTETVKTKYRGINLEIDLIKMFGTDRAGIAINGIIASSPLVKTKQGIGIGSTKLQIINAFENYHVDARPVFTDWDRLIKSRTKTTVTVKEAKEGPAILFHLVNNRVVSFHIFPDYDDEE
jgi:hypothetical protein